MVCNKCRGMSSEEIIGKTETKGAGCIVCGVWIKLTHIWTISRYLK